MYPVALENLKDLQVFVQAVESKNLAAAARTLGLAPSIVSRRLARLERSLGVRLLQRTTRSLSITDEGRAFYRRCRNILSELDAAETEVAPSQSEVIGTVRVVVPSSTVVHGIMQALHTLLEAHPHLTLQIRLSDRPADLQSGGWDVAVHVGTLPDSTHISRRLCRISPCLAATPEYLARHGIPKTPADLANHRCVRFGPDRNQDFWSVVDADGMTDRVPIGGQIICEDRVASSAAVRAGLGIAAIPQSVLRRAEADGTLSEVLPGSRAEAVTLYALIPSGRHRVPRIRVVVAWLATFMQDLFEDKPSGGK
jgi:DNA-binding transcriptional LysR family regulator